MMFLYLGIISNNFITGASTSGINADAANLVISESILPDLGGISIDSDGGNHNQKRHIILGNIAFGDIDADGITGEGGRFNIFSNITDDITSDDVSSQPKADITGDEDTLFEFNVNGDAIIEA